MPTYRAGPALLRPWHRCPQPSVPGALRQHLGIPLACDQGRHHVPAGDPEPAPGHSASWLVKRVIGLPGDRITCCDAAGRRTVNGVPLAEPYVAPGDRPSEMSFTVTVQQGRLWVMGDHRSASMDSRYHRNRDDGQVPVDQVMGRVTTVSSHGSSQECKTRSRPDPRVGPAGHFRTLLASCPSWRTGRGTGVWRRA